MSKITIAIIAFLLIGAVMIKCTLDTDFSEKDDRKSFLSAFVDWVKQLGTSTKETAKFAVTEQDWLPDKDRVKEAANDTNDTINETQLPTEEVQQ